MSFKNLFSLAVLSIGLFFTISLQAQDEKPMMQQTKQDIEVSDAELKIFLKISKELQMLNYQLQQKAMQYIQNSSISMERYKEIASKQQQGMQPKLTQEEQNVLSSFQQEMQKEQQAMKPQMDSILSDYAMGQNRFVVISRAMQTDKELQQRFREMQQKQQPQMQQQQIPQQP